MAGTSVASSCLREVEDLDIFRNALYIIVCEANETYVGRFSVRETGPDKTYVPQEQLVASVSWLFREKLNPRLTLIGLRCFVKSVITTKWNCLCLIFLVSSVRYWMAPHAGLCKPSYVHCSTGSIRELRCNSSIERIVGKTRYSGS